MSNRQLARPLPLGDIADVEAFVHRIVATLSAVDSDEVEELVGDGLELVCSRHRQLAAGESLQAALNGWLAWRLRDRLRERHPERRRNSRAATSYTLPAATGLSWEHDPAAPQPAGTDIWATVDSRLNLRLFQREQDLRDPRRVGRYLGVPSAAALATGVAHDLSARIRAERTLTSQPPRLALDPDSLL